MNNKSLKIFLILFLSMIVIVLLIFFVNLLTNKNFAFKNFNLGYKVSNELVVSKEYQTIFSTIKINAKASDIKIKNTNENKVKVIIYGQKEETKVETTESTLEITIEQKPCIGFCFHQKMAKIEIYLPNSYKGNMNFINHYGNINIARFDHLILDAKLSAGDIEADSLITGNIKNDYGDIKIKGYSKKLKITQACGDIKIDRVGRAQIENNYGNIDINNVDEYLKIKEDCGDIKINSLNLKENSNIHNSYGDIEINTTNEIYIKSKTNLGDTKINHNYPKSDIILDIDNSCGDIEVNN